MRFIQDILKKTKYNPSQLELFLTECYMDYIYFAEHVLGFEIAAYHREWYELIEKFGRLSLQAFRGSGKTHFIAGFFVWKAIFNEKKTFLVLSHNYENAKLVLKVVKEMFLNNEVLVTFAPEDNRFSWRANELTLKNNSIFFSRTYGENVRGLRIDWLLCDEAGQYDDKGIFWTAVSPVVQLNRGRIIVIGTPKSPIDLLNELHENEEYFSKKYSSEIGGKPLWPQKYTCDSKDSFGKRSLVQVKREIGALNYQQEYMLIPISSANALFPADIVLPALDNTERFMPFGKKGESYFVGVDLAVAKDGDYNVYTVLGKGNEGKKIVLAERFRGGINQQLDTLKRIYADFQPQKIIVDKTGLGEQIFKEFKNEISSVQSFHFTAEEKHNLIMDLRHEFEVLKIMIPNNKEDLKTYNFSQQLFKELQDFQIKVDLSRKTKMKFTSGKYDDCVISLALANRAAQNIDGNISIGFV